MMGGKKRQNAFQKRMHSIGAIPRIEKMVFPMEPFVGKHCVLKMGQAILHEECVNMTVI
jgi:hypothetical protein